MGLDKIQQLSLIATETIAAPVGLVCYEGFLADHEESELLAHIDGSEWLNDLSRRVQHYGYKYDYTSRRLDQLARIRPLPKWLADLSHRVRETASDEAKGLLVPSQQFAQAIINEYEPGQGIAPHIDKRCFGPVIATVSLGSAVNMDFIRESTEKPFVQRLEPRSLVVLHGEARDEWCHGIAKRKSDKVNGVKVERRRRVSITFRTIASPTPTHT